jgi:hypothetical protein
VSEQDFITADRKKLFLELARRPEGATPVEVHQRACELGDAVTAEAYYNIARRLVHRGLLLGTVVNGSTRYILGASADAQWLEEDDLAAMVDPEYPLLAVGLWRESHRQIDDIPEAVWEELRLRLQGENALALFFDAIVSYCDDLHAQISTLALIEDSPARDITQVRREADNSILLLQRLTKYGLGLSREAVAVPLSLDSAIADFQKHRPVSYVDIEILRGELQARIADEPVVTTAISEGADAPLLIAAVDGSTRSGMLSFLGHDGDLSLGHAPLIAINTAVGQTNRSVREGKKQTPIFMRLPEKPEDMQRQDNRYTVMAKLLYSDLSDAEYMHSVWNAMDLLEARATLRLLRRWYTTQNLEMPPADIVLRDGTVSPQDRDFSHYQELSSYGKIVRDMIETNWEIARTATDNHQTVAGVVKAAQLSVYAPVINWFACRVARDGTGQLLAWPLNMMNLMPDQLLITRLLTARRRKGEEWMRTCIVLRPFHALSNFAKSYSSAKLPTQSILKDYEVAQRYPDQVSQEKRLFWQDFRPASDFFMKMLSGVAYGNCFVAAVPRLDVEKVLPRFEFIVSTSTNNLWLEVSRHRDRLLKALTQTSFEVSAEHQMFEDRAKLDVLPTIVIRAHDTVKLWATELLSRVEEFVTYYLARYVKSKKIRGVRVRPFTKMEFELLYAQLRADREQRAGAAAVSPSALDLRERELPDMDTEQTV